MANNKPKAWTDLDLRKPDTWDRELNDDEKQWLRDRDQHALIATNAEEYGGEVPEELPTEPTASPQTKSALDPHATGTVTPEVLPVPEGGPVDDYDEWKVKELQAEADKRGVDYAPTDRKADLIRSLRAWDAEHPDD
jgi:hypothetical protein